MGKKITAIAIIVFLASNLFHLLEETAKETVAGITMGITIN